MNQELVKKAEDLKQKREELQKKAVELRNEMEQIKMQEKQLFGICEGESVTIPDIIGLIARLQ